ncbi:MAG: hypothetical protein AAF501_16185 [Pseudomonadota bacterium]
MIILAILFGIAGIACVFAGKTVIAAAISHVQETYPDEFARLSKHGLLPIKGLSGDADRARRGLAGPLLTGFLAAPLREDPVIRQAKTYWRIAFFGIIAFFVLALIALSNAG